MKSILILVTFLAYSLILPNAEASDNFSSTFSLESSDANGNLTLIEKWQILEKKFKGIANSAVKMALPVLMDNSGKLNLSNECIKNSMHLLSGIKNIKTWAIRFLDSSGKIIDGMLTATMSSFGEYDECVMTEVKSTRLRDVGKLLFRGQYCTIEFTPPLPPKRKYKIDEMSKELENITRGDTFIAKIAEYSHYMHMFRPRLGICVPSGCTVEDINQIVRTLGETFMFDAKASRCEVKEEKKFTPLIIAVISCYSFVSFLMLVGSLIDMYAYYKKIDFKNNFIRVLIAFSFISNFKKFVNMETASNTLSCLNGVRFLSMTWVMLGHTYLNLNFQMMLSLENAKDFVKDFALQPVANGHYAVDTFFFIGGLLVCYTTIKLVLIQGHSFNVGLYIFHRLWRIMPVYVFVIMFMFLLNLMGSGPVWHDVTSKHIEACYDNWWANLIFINNFYGSKHVCVGQSWYLASDFQLYVASLIILLPMIRWPRVGIILSVLAIMASIVYCGVATYVNNYPFQVLFTNPDPEIIWDYIGEFYFRPFIHASPYCIGLLSGYLLATKPDLKISPFVQVIGWSLAFICDFSVLYGLVEWNRGSEPSFVTGILYTSLCRTVWTLGVAWMIICCATGHGGIINYILSWKAFIPLGRLTFVAYLVHFQLQMVFIGNVRTLLQIEHFLIVWIYFGHLCATYGIAFVGSMLIEAPFLSLEKIILPRKKDPVANSLFKGNFDLKETFESHNFDVSSIIPKKDEESGGIDNTFIVNKL